MAAKKLVRKDVIRLARQKLWTDIGKALDSYEKHVYGDRALGSKRAPEGFPERASVETAMAAYARRNVEAESREGDITSVEEIERILPPEDVIARGRKRVRKRSPVSDHIRGDKPADPYSTPPFSEPNEAGLSASAEKVLILIVQSTGGMTPAQIAIKITKLKKRTIQNILTELKSWRYILKDENHGKFRATEEGKAAVKGRFVEMEKGAILEELSESERKVLFAIASKKEGVTLSAISVMVPNITKRTKQNIITALKTRELIEKNEDRFVLTEYARDELKGKLQKPLTGKALREHLSDTLPDPQASVLEWLSYDGGRTATPAEIAMSLGYAPRTVQNIFTALKAQELVVKHDGRFQLSTHLKD